MTAKRRRRVHPLRALRTVAQRLSKRLSFRVFDWRARIRRLALNRVTFVGVTGSCGKTTTTALIQEVLAKNGLCQAWINEPRRLHHWVRVRQAVLSVGAGTRYCL